MRGLVLRYSAFLRMLFFKNVKGENRLIFNITGLFFVVITQFLLSGVLFFFLHTSITRFDNRLEADLKLAKAIKTDLAILSFEPVISAPALKKLLQSADLLSRDTRRGQSWKLMKASLRNLDKDVSGSEKGWNNQEIDDGLIKCRVLTDELVRFLIEKRQNINDKLLSKIIIFEIGLILITIILVCTGSILLTKNLRKQQSEIAYFESLAYQLKGGLLDKIQYNYQGKALTDLNEALIKYIQLLKERYQAVKDQFKNINFQANEISLFSKQNNIFYEDIKGNLEHLVEHTYYQVDQYQILAERIKELNTKLGDSEEQIILFRESLKSGVKVFREAPEAIKEIEIQVKKREQYLKKITGDLYQLQSLLDQLLQTGSIFQNVAEQNTLLALNASIEAARADTAAGGFDIAAEEIARLAEKIGRVSKELLAVVDVMGNKGSAALKTLEIDLTRSNEVKRFIEAVGNKISIFCLRLGQLLEEAIQYSIQIEELEDKRKSLEELASSLIDLNQKSQNNYGRAEAAIEVIKKSGETMAATEQLDTLISELKQLMNKIAI